MPSPGGYSPPGIEPKFPVSPVLQADSLSLSHARSPVGSVFPIKTKLLGFSSLSIRYSKIRNYRHQFFPPGVDLPAPGRSAHLNLMTVYDLGSQLSPSQALFQRRQWQPTPVLLPGVSHGRRSLVDCRLWGRAELDTTDVT